MNGPSKIIVSNWGRFTVISIEPRRVDRPSRTFRNPREAFDYATELNWTEGWPVEDRRLRPDNGPRAA